MVLGEWRGSYELSKGGGGGLLGGPRREGGVSSTVPWGRGGLASDTSRVGGGTMSGLRSMGRSYEYSYGGLMSGLSP